MAHLKRLYAPRTWDIARKNRKFIVRPRPGGHPMERSLPLLSVVRDILHSVRTARELKTLLREKKILVDGRARSDAHTSVGLFDVLSFPTTGESYRIVITSAGKLLPVIIKKDESTTKICKIVQKCIIPGGKTQIGLHDGRVLITDLTLSVGDSVVFNILNSKIEQILKMDKGAQIYLIGGKHQGSHGKLQNIAGQTVTYEHSPTEKNETLKKYVIVVGKDKPLITINHDNS